MSHKKVAEATTRVVSPQFHEMTYVCIVFEGFLGGGNSKKYFIFTPKIGEDEPMLTN